MNEHDESRRAIEAIVLAATEPVHPTVMAQLLELSVEAIEDLCAQLGAIAAERAALNQVA